MPDDNKGSGITAQDVIDNAKLKHTFDGHSVTTTDLVQQFNEEFGEEFVFTDEMVRAVVTALSQSEQLLRDLISLVSTVHEESRHLHVDGI